MFSEYASRFLAQSASHISFRDDPRSTNTNSPLDRRRHQQQQNGAGLGVSRLMRDQSQQRAPLGRSNMRSSRFSQLPFTNRQQPQAPLFLSASEAFREENDEEEHEREAEDLYALERSRRQFVPSRLGDSSEQEDDHAFEEEEQQSTEDVDANGFQTAGIRSSWRGPRRQPRLTGSGDTLRAQNRQTGHDRQAIREEDAEDMHDVRLASSTQSNMSDVGEDPPAYLLDNNHNGYTQDSPPQRGPPLSQLQNDPISETTDMLLQGVNRDRAGTAMSDTSTVPPTVAAAVTGFPQHDPFWATLYCIAMLGLVASFVLVWLHTYTPSEDGGNGFLGDTIYTTLRASYFLLAVDTLVAVVVSLLWIALLSSYVRPLVYVILVAVPVILFSFTLYPFISSFLGEQHGQTVQDWLMRWFSLVPGLLGVLWVYGVFQGRHSLGKAIGLLEFACKILAANSSLLGLGFGAVAGVVVWSWVWMLMFTRVFLGGHFNSLHRFLIDVGTWWLGAFFVLMYLWTLNVGGGVQRASTAATVSQWYFHRLAVPAPTSNEVVRAAFSHSMSTLFGTICFSTLLALLIRLPVLIMPRRMVALVSFCSYTLLPNSVMILTHPITLTYAAIHSQPLVVSARAVSQLSFMSRQDGISARHFARQRNNYTKSSSNLPHRLALLLLHSTRLVMSMAFGFSAWVSTAHSLEISARSTGQTSTRGSLYAYVVGLIAGAIGWAVLGAMEGVLTGIVDAVVVCWASEIGDGTGEVRYCREADYLLGGNQNGIASDEEEGLVRR